MSERERILLVEDDDGMRLSCRKVLEAGEFEVLEASSPQSAELLMSREDLQLIVTDLRMPGGGGEEVVRMAGSILRGVPVVVITAYPTVQSAIDSFKAGIMDYLVKPFTADQLLECVRRVLAEKRDRENCETLLHAPSADPLDAEAVGSSPALRALLADIRRVAATEGSVLVTGEPGLMKAHTAQAIHRHSARAGGPLVIVSCALLPSGLLETDLLGYERQAIPGATEARPGLLEEANRGIILFDEVGELSLEVQAQVLRCIEEGSVRRIGGTERRRLDMRVLATTSRDLAKEVRESRFREDLLQRLSEFQLRVPPLRERKEDIAAIAVRFLDSLNAGAGSRSLAGFSQEALLALRDYAWPGNLRELQNAVRRAHANATGSLVTLQDLLRSGAFQPGEKSDWTPADREAAMSRFERQHLADALARHKGNVTKAAEALGIHRTTLQRLMKRHHLGKG
ncbi:MAG: sigma-54-dependent Fis family transcriptional regulator [Planctomycetes bacterium]|nr:sigma-54-dependent Fis family transcriptional regulator [Planctomycetota bacterium]